MSVSPLIVKYEKTLARNPRSQVFAPLSALYRKIGMMEKSREALQKGIRYNPDYIPGYIELAYYYMELSEYQLAHATLRPLINSNRDNLKLQKLFVECCMELEYKNEALDTLKYLLFLNPKDKELALKIKDLEREESAIPPVNNESSIKFDVDSLDGESVEDEDYANWVEVDTTGRQEKDNSNDGWNIENLRSVEEEAKISRPRVNHALVDIYMSQGHIEKAREVIKKILEIQPDDLQAREKLDEIENLLEVSTVEYDNDIGEIDSTENEIFDVEPSVEKQTSDFNSGSLMEVYDRKIAGSNFDQREKVSQKLDHFLEALRERGSTNSRV